MSEVFLHKDVKKEKNEDDHIWESEIQNLSYDNGEIYVKSEAHDKAIDHMVEIDVKEEKNIADQWEAKNQNLSHDNGEINVKSEVDDNTIGYTINKDANLKTKEFAEIFINVKIKNESVENICDIKIKEECVENDNDIENLDNLPEDKTNKQVSEDGPQCARRDLTFPSQEAFAKRADERTIKIIPGSSELMVLCGNKHANALRVDLRKYNASLDYARNGAPIKKPKADSLNEKNSSKTPNEVSLETVTSDAKIPELSKKTDCLEDIRVKHKVNCKHDCTETVVEGDDKNNSLTESAKDTFVCDECGQQFDEKHSIIWHLKTEHMQDVFIEIEKCADSTVSKDSAQSPVKRHPCPECGRKFRYRHHMFAHMATHTNKNIFTCTVCNKQIRRVNNFTAHMRTHTQKKKLYSCTVCNKEFLQHKYLAPHMRTHTGEKPYSCSVCNKSFNRKDVLRSHMKLHSDVKPYSCTVCDQQFGLKIHSILHMRRHTGERPFPCTVCTKRFIDNSGLIRHMRIHTGEKPYTCVFCDKPFTHRGYWQRHSEKCGDRVTRPLTTSPATC